ncbi:queuine trna-ribosyltransferase [Phaffia rhodozyma]|uniref:Queuine tRNA-ribosyltransferase catalytic subunit 1 n=1 Tax=Phaffia rhodozyma TaxID=264483 RepID=A0A0F7SM57_PHARH|nr:queuine trna-ribosyltransferase [Phaffia rhodozyma]
MKFEVLGRCSTTKARVCRMTLPHGPTILPTFMPVATQGTIKGLTPQQTASLGVTLQLNNTYHLSLQPGVEVLDKAGGAHKFQGWNGNLLTDSGGFQMVSLLKFTQITEEGVLFASPFDGKPTMLTPEQSIAVQHSIGSDIMMQLDDVVSSLTTGPRVEEAMWRSVRWLDRCLKYHATAPPKAHRIDQKIFAIVQGGLDPELRKTCCAEMVKRKDDAGLGGFAIGGLSGGEEKDVFWKVISQCTDLLPADRPRYSMGVGYAEDLLVVVALGVDMADCVFPTRTARFGMALTFDGPLNTRSMACIEDHRVIEEDCPCPTCRSGMSRAALNHMSSTTNSHHAITLHNIAFQARLMGQARTAILEDTYPAYLKRFFPRYFANSQGGIPSWCVDALRSVGVDLGDHVSAGARTKRKAHTQEEDEGAKKEIEDEEEAAMNQ